MQPTVNDRVRKHREALRAAGLKPVQLWLPDTRSAAFRRKCRKESLLLSADPLEAETLDWIARTADTDGWK
ncbi:MAG: antitoxin MazE family protein [Terracidiphilus sp.]